MRFRTVTNAKELESLINDIGFLPLFKNEIPGYSVQECTPQEYWFVAGVDGPWEWKEQIAVKSEIAYGKLMNKKAAFISKEWFPILANYRRNGYDFDALYEDGYVSKKAKDVVDLLFAGGDMLSTQLKDTLQYKKGGNTGFETVITQLQMQTYVEVKTFEYKKDKHGKSYGWGIARYDLAERLYGYEYTRSGYKEEPVRSKEQILTYMHTLLPDVDELYLNKIIR